MHFIMHSIIRLPYLSVPALCAVCLLQSGCLPDAEESDDEEPTPSALQEQAASASQSLGLLMDATTEASLAAVAQPTTRSGGGEAAPDLTQLNGIRTFDLATLTTNGQPLFSSVTTTGTITVTHVGTSVSSSPVGSTKMYTGNVSVALSAIVITNGNGDRLSIPSGTFSYSLTSLCTTTDATNWVLDQRTTVAIDPAFDATVIHSGRSFNLTMRGNRSLHQVITREYGSGIDRRTVRREISGTTNGQALSTDPVIGGHQYASWRITVEGIPVTWYRFANVTTVADYTQLPGSSPSVSTSVSSSVSSSDDATFIAVLGIVIGPRTASQWSALLGARLQAEFL